MSDGKRSPEVSAESGAGSAHSVWADIAVEATRYLLPGIPGAQQAAKAITGELAPALKDFGNLIIDAAKYVSEQLPVSAERSRLENSFESRVRKPEDLKLLRKEMDDFEKRAAKDGLSPDEVRQTYKEIGRFLEENKGSVVPQDRHLLLAKQVLHESAQPHDLDQGNHNTCNVSSLSERLYTRNPSQAARVVSDLALSKDGSFLTASGKAVKVDKDSLKPDQEAELDPIPDGKRSYANQILQLAMVNAYWTGRSEHEDKQCRTPITYKQDHAVSQGNSGERLVDGSGKLLANRPDITHAGMVEVYRMFSKEPDKEKPFLILDESMTHEKDKPGSNGLIFVGSSEALKEVLLKQQSEKHMPLIVSIDPKQEPWTSAGADSSTHHDGGVSGKPGSEQMREDLREHGTDKPEQLREDLPEQGKRKSAATPSSGGIEQMIDRPPPEPEESKDPPHVINILACYQDKAGRWMVDISNTWGHKSDITLPLNQLYDTLARPKRQNDSDSSQGRDDIRRLLEGVRRER